MGRTPPKRASSPLLDGYAAKRNFSLTSEPAAELEASRSGPLLFVVQQHAASRLHFDLRLEVDGTLKSWAIPKGPSLDPADKRTARMTEDHPVAYAAFEGLIPAGEYGGGDMIVWDCGTYSPDSEGRYDFHDRDAAQARMRADLAAGKASIFLLGQKLKGSFTLVRTGEGGSWLFIKHRDPFVQSPSSVLEQDRSVLSGVALQDHEALGRTARIPLARAVPTGRHEAFPQRLLPMMAELADAPFNDPEWLFEPKLDGYRMLAFVRNGKVSLASRRSLDYTRMFPVLIAELAANAVTDQIIDGEIIALDESGRPSFNALQNRSGLATDAEVAAAEANIPVIFYAFDLLHFAGMDLRAACYVDRRRFLGQCLLPSAHVKQVYAQADGPALYEAALAAGFEGIMAKRKTSVYEAGRRSAQWLKVKQTSSAEFVIGGYALGQGGRARLGSLIVGYRDDDGRLRYAAHVGTGYNESLIDDLLARFASLVVQRSPFAEHIPPRRGTVWLQPQLVAEVRFANWTEADHLRAPVFVRLRDDVDPASVKRVTARHVPSRDERPKPAREPRSAPLTSGSGKTTGKAGSHTETEAKHLVAALQTDASQLIANLDGHAISLTHLDRVYWPAHTQADDGTADKRTERRADESSGNSVAAREAAITKRDFLIYLAQVSASMLPHLRNRPLTLFRWPGGISARRVLQKHWEIELPAFVERVNIFSETKGQDDEYILCNNLATLIWLGEMGTLEFHGWHSRIEPRGDDSDAASAAAGSMERLRNATIDFPDYVLFDLDPYIYSGLEKTGREPEFNPAAFDKSREVALRLKQLLDAMALASWVKTSGKTGLHVIVPIEPSIRYDAVRGMAQFIGRHLMETHPGDVTMDWSVPRRSGKVFLDYNMNVRGKSMTTPYSPRGLPGAPVSMPLSWRELEHADPTDYRVSTVPAQLRRHGDRWEDVLRTPQDLQAILSRKSAK